ncbi:hypothetical protein [Agrococcus casei]
MTVPGGFPVYTEPGDFAAIKPLAPLEVVGATLFVAAWLCEAVSTTLL